MKKFLKIIGILLLLLAIVTTVAFLKCNESEPEGSNQIEADIMGRQLLETINAKAWDELRYVQWTFAGRHDFLWDKESNRVQVTWEEHMVDLDISTENGRAYKNGQEVGGSVAKDMIDDAWSYFCNDSFWLNAPAKVMDEGTVRSLVKLEGGGIGLKVTYTKGGVTPGDSYLWILDEQGRPKAYKMWVKIIPLGGMEFSWEDWVTLPGGAQISTLHRSSGPDLRITNLKAGMSLEDLE